MIRRVIVGLVLACGGWTIAQEFPQNGQANQRNVKPAPSVTVGPIRVTAANTTVQRAMVMGHVPHAVNMTTLTINVVADPSASVSSISDFKIDTLLDQNGRPIKPQLRRAQGQLPLNENRTSLTVEMPDLPGDITDISRIVGSFNAAVAKSEPIELTDLKPNHSVTKQTAGGDTVTLGFKNNPEGFEVAMQAELKPGAQVEQQSRAKAIASAPIRVLDAAGNVYFGAGGSTQNTGGQVNHTVKFRTGQGTRNVSFGPPAKIVFAMPTSLTTTPVNFEFKDLALPGISD